MLHATSHATAHPRSKVRIETARHVQYDEPGKVNTERQH
jgi:hypothetical protein